MTARENSKDRYLYMRKLLSASHYDGKRFCSLKTFLKKRYGTVLFFVGYNTSTKKFSKKSYDRGVYIGSDYGFGGNYNACIMTTDGKIVKRFEEKLFLVLLTKIEKHFENVSRKKITSNE